MKKCCVFKTDLIVIFILLLAGFRFTFRLESFLDIGLYDESDYLFGGVKLVDDGFPDTAYLPLYAPLYAVWYYILSLLQPDRVKLYYLNYKVLSVLPSILLYVLLRRYKSSELIATLISFFFLICSANLPVWPKVSHFSLVLVLTSFIFACGVRSFASTILLACLGALSSSYVRPEFFLTFLLLLLLYIGLIIARFGKLRLAREMIAFLAFASTSGFLISLFGLPLWREDNRSFAAFVQHFSLNWVSWTGSELNPWTDWGEIVFQNFGDIQTIPAALISNPLLFAKHMASNLVGTVRRILSLFSSHSGVAFPDNQVFVRIERYLLLGVSALHVFHSRGKWLPKLRENFEEHRGLLVLFSCYLLPSFVSTIVIFPRDHYLLLPGVLAIIATALFVVNSSEGKRELEDHKKLMLVGFLVISLTPYISYQSTGKRKNVETVMLIKSLEIEREVNLLEAEGGYGIYVGDNFQRVAEYDKNTNFNAFLSDRKINMIVVTDRLRNDTRFRDDEEWKFFLSNCATSGYEKMNIPNTDRQLIVSKKLLSRD